MNIPARSQFKVKHVGVQSHNFVHNRRKRFVWGCVLGVIAIVTLTFALSKITHLGVFDIQAINIRGADSEISPNLQLAALGAIQGNYLGLFAKSNTFTYPAGAIAQAVKNSDFRVSNVIVSRSGLQGLDVIVREKDPSAVICVNLPNWDNSDLTFDAVDSCYLVDDTGFAFMHATTSNSGLHRFYIPSVGDTEATTSIIGTRVASTTLFRTLQSFYNRASSSGIDAKALLVAGGGEYEMYAGTKSAGVIVIYFNEINDLENELTALVSFWNDVSQKVHTKGEVRELDSIDLRYGSNVFYRTTK